MIVYPISKLMSIAYGYRGRGNSRNPYSCRLGEALGIVKCYIYHGISARHSELITFTLFKFIMSFTRKAVVPPAYVTASLLVSIGGLINGYVSENQDSKLHS